MSHQHHRKPRTVHRPLNDLRGDPILDEPQDERVALPTKIGIDIGNVIITNAPDGDGQDTSFGRNVFNNVAVDVRAITTSTMPPRC
jgi:hypothetical protein